MSKISRLCTSYIVALACYDDIYHDQKLKQPIVNFKIANLEFKPHK